MKQMAMTSKGDKKETTHNIHKEENKEVGKNKKTNKKGYMAAKGKPTQPRKTQDNKAGTLRYEQETETWHCTKCPKTYSKHNAVRAKSHAAAHTKEEKKNGPAREEETRREEAKKEPRRIQATNTARLQT